MSGLVSSAWRGASAISTLERERRLIHTLVECSHRHDGLRFRLSARQIPLPHSRRKLHPLPNNQVRFRLLPCISNISSLTVYWRSTDMLHRVSSRLSTHTNSTLIASSRALSALKLAYYVVFAKVYSWSLRKAGVVWVNSSWTRGHVEGLIGAKREEEEEDKEGEVLLDNGEESSTTKLRQRRTLTKAEPAIAAAAPPRTPKIPSTSPRIRLLYPPCDTVHLSSLPLSTSSRIGLSEPIIIISLAQFRPEKEHSTQLHALAFLLSSPTLSPTLKARVKLVCAGSVRNEADAQRVEALRALARELGVEDKVEFVVNAGYAEICEWMGKASVGLHTMVDEHFGITVVEFQVRRSNSDLICSGNTFHRGT